jgi:bacteriocin biosynthesis cyclodehydratase domain-containing protein
MKTDMKEIGIRLRPTVGVYELKDNSILFRSGGRMLRLEKRRESLDLENVVKKMCKGLSVEEFVNDIGISEHEEASRVLNALSSNDLISMNLSPDGVAEDGTAECLFDEYTAGGLFSVQSIADVFRGVVVNMCVPECLAGSISNLLKSYGVRIETMEVKRGDRRLSLTFPESDKSSLEDITVLYIEDDDPEVIGQLAYYLSRKNRCYIPIQWDDEALIIGPVVTNDGPCLQCYHTRRIGNRAHPEVYSLLYGEGVKVIKRGQRSLSPAYANITASAVYALIASHVFGVQPVEALSRKSRFYRILGPAINVENCVLFKDPICQACSGETKKPNVQEFCTRERHVS